MFSYIFGETFKINRALATDWLKKQSDTENSYWEDQKRTAHLESID